MGHELFFQRGRDASTRDITLDEKRQRYEVLRGADGYWTYYRQNFFYEDYSHIKWISNLDDPDVDSLLNTNNGVYCILVEFPSQSL